MGILSQIGSFLGFSRQTQTMTQSPAKLVLPESEQVDVLSVETEVPAVQEKISTFQAAESKVAEPYKRRFPGC